jgi:hypothetical protein
MESIDNLGLINTLKAINLVINNLGFKHLKAQIKTLNSDLQQKTIIIILLSSSKI